MYKGATTLKDVVFALMTLIPIDHFSFFKKISFNFKPSQDKRMESFFLNQAFVNHQNQSNKTNVKKQIREEIAATFLVGQHFQKSG